MIPPAQSAQLRAVIERVDSELVREEMPVWRRLLAAPLRVEQELPEAASPTGQLLSPATIHEMVDAWYQQRYGRVCRFPAAPLLRPVIIRGEVYRMRVEAEAFTNALPKGVDQVEGLSHDLAADLGQAEVQALQQAIELFHQQAVNVLTFVCLSAVRAPSALCAELADRSKVDLEHATMAFDQSDPSAILFTCQQAVEKTLKAAMAWNDPLLTDAQLKTSYGHSLQKLLADVRERLPALGRLVLPSGLAHALPNTRYQRQPLWPSEGIAVLDSAWEVCSSVGVALTR